MSKNDSAFPHPELIVSSMNFKYFAEPGLTKRELFAAMALQGLLANPRVVSRNVSTGDVCGREDVSVMACTEADMLLAELEKKS